jgi:DNA-binding CsgD family transcriptional regulator
MDDGAGGMGSLIGRAAEQAILRERLAGLARGRGALALIGGEAGIGKTTLAEAALTRARGDGAAVAIGRCYERGVAPPFAPWPDLLAALAAAGALDLAGLPAPFGAAPPATTAYQLMRAVVAALHAAAARRPVAILLDDLQWADQEALDLLDLATRQLDAAPLLALATYRSEEAGHGRPLFDFLPQLQRNRPASTITLGPLSAAETASLAEARLGACSDALIAGLHARADGNPLFLVAWLDDLAARGRLGRDGAGRWAAPAAVAPTPPLLRQLAEQRVDRLGEETATLLNTAAVVGQEWDLGVVEAALAWPEELLLAALAPALAGQVIAPAAETPERYRFAHGLIRDVLYDRQLARQRRRLHARIASILEGAGAGAPGAVEPAALAYHFGQAEDWASASRYSLAAGDEARQRAAVASAARFYQQALDFARRAAPPPETPLTTLYERLGRARLTLHQHAPAATAFTAMLEAARAGDDRLSEGRALGWLSFVHTRLSRLADARRLGEGALALAEQLAEPRLLAFAHANLGHLDKIAGEPAPAVRHLETAEPLARAAEDAETLCWSLQNLAHLAVWRGEYALAEAQAEEALALARRTRDALSLGGSTWILGLARGERGRYEPARQALQAGLDQADESGEHHYFVRLLNTMGWLHSELGDYATALAWDQRALAASQRGDADPATEAERYSLLNLATDELGLGRPDAAASHLRAFERVRDDNEYARLRYLNRHQLLLAEEALARGDGETALRQAEEAARLATTKGVRKNLAKGWLLAGRALLALDRPREAAERLRRSVALADELGHGSLRWVARLWLGRAATALRQRGEAASLFQQALDQVEALAAALPEARTRDAFLAAPTVIALREAADAASAPSAAVAVEYPAGLSAREVEVLRLVAQGETNQAIAEALSISVKTVNAHMTSIFNKTGSANRAAAASFALRHRLA